MSVNPFDVIRQFEHAIAEYCGSPLAVSCTSCTAGILLACAWFRSQGLSGQISMPKYSYVGVPMSIKHAGFDVVFRDEDWSGEYQLFPLPLWDSARRTTRDMYRPGQMQVLSLHWSKVLGVQQGGIILLDDPEAADWLRRCRYDGRREGVPPAKDTFDMLGYHFYMSPETAAAALIRLSLLPAFNNDLPEINYPDLSLMKIFQ